MERGVSFSVISDNRKDQLKDYNQQVEWLVFFTQTIIFLWGYNWIGASFLVLFVTLYEENSMRDKVFFFFFLSQWMELYFLKINSKSSGSCLLVSENEHNKIKRQIWLVDMKFSSQKYLSGMKGKFGGSFLVMFVTFFFVREVKEERSLRLLSPKSWSLREKMKEGP